MTESRQLHLWEITTRMLSHVPSERRSATFFSALEATTERDAITWLRAHKFTPEWWSEWIITGIVDRGEMWAIQASSVPSLPLSPAMMEIRYTAEKVDLISRYFCYKIECVRPANHSFGPDSSIHCTINAACPSEIEDYAKRALAYRSAIKALQDAAI